MGTGPELSLIMPCYNEQESIPFTIPEFVRVFESGGVKLELVACDNGSSDNTSGIIKQFVANGLPVVYHRVEVNEGYGNGILQSIPVCRAPWIGVIPADAQVDAEDVLRLFQVIRHTDGRTIGKVRRRFRMDGFSRKVISIVYNGLMFVLWPGLGTIDVNGIPKIIHRDVIAAMKLQSRQWFLDPEIMIKARHLGVRVLELNTFARMRSNGLSHVRVATCVEFVTGLVRFRFGGALNEWRRSDPKVVIESRQEKVTI